MKIYAGANFTATLEELPEILSWIKTQTTKYLDETAAMKMQLAAEEAVVNIICYAYSEKQNGEGEQLSLLVGEENVFFLEIADSGVAFNPLTGIDSCPSQKFEDRKLGGWGRELIMKMADRVSYRYENHYNILRLEKNIESRKAGE